MKNRTGTNIWKDQDRPLGDDQKKSGISFDLLSKDHGLEVHEICAADGRHHCPASFESTTHVMKNKGKIMLKSIFMRGLTMVTGICLTIALLQAVSLRAEELKPFLTLKIADPGTLMNVAEKIADLAGQRRDFDAGVASFRDLSGLNPKGPFGLILRSDGEEIREPIFVLPIEKLEDVNLPNFEAVMASAKKEGDGKYVLNSPLGLYNMYQKKGFVLITTADSEGPLPEDPAKLFAGLENYTLGFRVDLENTSLDSIEVLLAPIQMILAMQGGQAAQSAEQLSEAIELLHKEYRSVAGGIVFDPQTASLDFIGTYVPKKGSNAEKMIGAFKDMKTSFSGFAGMGADTIFSLSGIESDTQVDLEASMNAIDQILDGLLEQAEEQAETDADFELAETVAESFRKVVESTLKKGKYDFGCSMNAQGTLLLASTIGDTVELRKGMKAIFDHITTTFGEDEVNDNIGKYLKKEFETVEGFKISSFTFPFADIPDDDVPQTLKDKTVAAFWGVKENEAVALALGLDAKETEKKFREALEKTKSAVPVKQPLAFFAIQPLGKLLEKYVPKDMQDDTAEKVIALLSASPTDAKITLTTSLTGEAMEVKVSSSGTMVTTLANLFKILAASDIAESLDNTTIRDF